MPEPAFAAPWWSPADLDKARAALRPEFDGQLSKAGFEVVGWGDVGRARTFSRGFEVRLPQDLRGHSPVVGMDDAIAPKVLEVIGDMTGHPADVNEILPMLESGAADVVTAPALAVEQQTTDVGKSDQARENVPTRG